MKRFVVLVALLVSSGYASAGRTLTLEECRELAIQNNKELKISGEKIKMAGYEKNAAFTKYFPQLSATGAYMWNQKDINLLDMGALGASIGGALGPIAQLPVFGKLMEGVDDLQHLDIQNIWVGSVSLVQPVFMGGKIINYNQITKYAKQLAESMNDQQLQDVICKTDETYWQVISLVNKKKLADAYVDLLRKTDHDMTAMINEGVATEADGLSVKVKLNEAEMAQTKVDNGLALSRMLLAQICGLPLEDPLVLADEDIESFLTEPSVTAADVNEAFMNRNELKSLDLQDAREKVELQVNQSVYKVNEANKKLIVSTRNMENAEENLRHANLGFEEGVIPALNLMQAQTAWVSARSCLIDAQIEVKLTEVYLTKAMGKLGDELSGRTRNAD